MKKILIYSIILSFTANPVFAAPKFDTLKDLEADYVQALLENPFPARQSDQVKDLKLFKKLVADLLDLYAEDLWNKNEGPYQLSQGMKNYESQLLRMANRNNDFKKQIIKEYAQELKTQNLVNTEQVILAHLFTKHFNLASSDHLTLESKKQNAALAFRILTQAYVLAAHHESKTNQQQITKVSAAIYLQAAAVFLLSTGIVDYVTGQDILVKLLLGLSGTSVVSAVALRIVLKNAAEEQINLFWNNVSTNVGEGNQLNQHVEKLLSATSSSYSQLVKDAHALRIQKCGALLKFTRLTSI